MLGVMAAAGIGGGFLTAWRGVSPRMIRRSRWRLAACVGGACRTVSGTWPIWRVDRGGDRGGVSAWRPWVCPRCCPRGAASRGWVLERAWVMRCAMCRAVFLQIAGGPGMDRRGICRCWARSRCHPERLDGTERRPEGVSDVGCGGSCSRRWCGWIRRRFSSSSTAADLKSGTWGEAMLWRNAVLHLSMACVAGMLAGAGRREAFRGAAWVLLAVAALAVNADATRDLAGWFYPAGVSLVFRRAGGMARMVCGAPNETRRAWRAAWLFAIAGWFGSANGIGMAQTLERVPPVFVAGAGSWCCAVLVLSQQRTGAPALAVAAVAVCGHGLPQSASDPLAHIRGGARPAGLCFRRLHPLPLAIRAPGIADETIWGPRPGAGTVLAGQTGADRQPPPGTGSHQRRRAPLRGMAEGAFHRSARAFSRTARCRPTRIFSTMAVARTWCAISRNPASKPCRI